MGKQIIYPCSLSYLCHLQGFAHHVACEHNMWDYIYFSLELDRTDTSDQNAIQLFVYNQVRQYDFRLTRRDAIICMLSHLAACIFFHIKFPLLLN